MTQQVFFRPRRNSFLLCVVVGRFVPLAPSCAVASVTYCFVSHGGTDSHGLEMVLSGKM